MQPTLREGNRGFTLIEMLIVAPLIILILAGFIAVMINMVGSVLISQEKSRVTYDTEQALAQMELDIHTATKFPTTTGMVNSPQGSNDGTSPWNASATGPLILTNYATKLNPVNTNGQNSLFYINNHPYDCSDDNHIYNPVYTIYTVYFIRDNNLYRRTIFPNVASTGKPPTSADICDDSTSGASPWQQNSCTTGSGGYCKTQDDLVAPSISSMKLTYYETPGSTSSTTDQTAATTVSITLTGSSSASGENFTYTGTLRANRANVAS